MSSEVIESESVHVTINGLSYLLVHADNLQSFSFVKFKSGLPKDCHVRPPKPFVIYHDREGGPVTRAKLEHFRSTVLEKDASFQPAFFEWLVVCTRDPFPFLDESARKLLESWNANFRDDVYPYPWRSASEPRFLPEGPYVGWGGMIWQPWRVFPDPNLTMTTTFTPGRDGNSVLCHSRVQNRSIDPTAAFIAVPPKSYALTASPADKFLAGTSVVVMDIFDISGSKTTMCDRAWTNFHDIKTVTAPCIKRLEDLGAWIAGKTRLIDMAFGEDPMECVEWLAPFNPRGDGYQTPSGSSSGSAAAVGAYDFVDFAIGLDTHGSGRKPAQCNGCFAVRPTHGALEMNGVTSFCPFYDVPTFFGRDISRFREFAYHWYGGSQKVNKRARFKPKATTFYYPTDFFPRGPADQALLTQFFICDLEGLLGVKRIRINLRDLWRDTRPEGADPDLAKYLETAAVLPYYKDACGSLQSFMLAYKLKCGRNPFVREAHRWRMDQVCNMSVEERNEGWERVYTYRKWLLKHVLHEGAVLILPVADGEPEYRDAKPADLAVPSGYSPLFISPVAGSPEVTAPVGEVTYHSKITRRIEPMPVCVSVTSAPGTDLALIDLVHRALQYGQKPTCLTTGKSIDEGSWVDM